MFFRKMNASGEIENKANLDIELCIMHIFEMEKNKPLEPRKALGPVAARKESDASDDPGNSIIRVG